MRLAFLNFQKNPESGFGNKVNPVPKKGHEQGGVKMPRFDGSGPMGAGPMTGGGRGYCRPAGVGTRRLPGESTYYGRGMAFGRGFRGGFGFGRGIRRGFGRGFYPYFPAFGETSADDLGALKQEADSIKTALNSIQRRISELEDSD